MKIENADPIPINESVLKPWRVNMKKQSSSIDEKTTKFPEGVGVGASAGVEEVIVATNGKNEEKPWRNHMKKSISVESQPSAYCVVVVDTKYYLYV